MALVLSDKGAYPNPRRAIRVRRNVARTLYEGRCSWHAHGNTSASFANTRPPRSPGSPGWEVRAFFDGGVPTESLRPLREAAEQLASFPSAPSQEGFARWQALLSWFERTLADTLPAYLDIAGSTAETCAGVVALLPQWTGPRVLLSYTVHNDPERPHHTLHVAAAGAYGWLRRAVGQHTFEDGVTAQVWPDVEGLAVPTWDEQGLRIESIPHRNSRGVG